MLQRKVHILYLIHQEPIFSDFDFLAFMSHFGPFYFEPGLRFFPYRNLVAQSNMKDTDWQNMDRL